jgi:hypothetical protein
MTRGMQMQIYLAKKNDMVIFHTDLTAMKELDGISKPEKTVSVEEWEAAGSTAHIGASGKIVLGRTPEELALEEKQSHIAALKDRLIEIDKDSGAGRALRRTAKDMGIMLMMLRNVAIDIGVMTEVLKEKVPGLTGFDPAENEALKLLIEYDPSEHDDLQRIVGWETEAEAIREKLQPLLQQEQEVFQETG